MYISLPFHSNINIVVCFFEYHWNILTFFWKLPSFYHLLFPKTKPKVLEYCKSCQQSSINQIRLCSCRMWVFCGSRIESKWNKIEQWAFTRLNNIKPLVFMMWWFKKKSYYRKGSTFTKFIRIMSIDADVFILSVKSVLEGNSNKIFVSA